MDRKPNILPGDVQMKDPAKDAEYECLRDMNEKHELSENKPETSKEEVTDIEASYPEPKADEAPAPNVPRAPLSHEEALALRIRAMDDIRTVAFCLILLQNAAIQAVSTHREASQVHETQPKMFVLIGLFVGLTRVLAVPLLFFVAGFSSYFAIVMHARSPIRFALRRTWKTAITVVFYQACAYLCKLALRPLLLAKASDTTPYYASREGILAVLNGPTIYVIAILALDYTYVLFRAANVFIYSPNKPTHFITTKMRYESTKFILFLLVEVWVVMGGLGFKCHILLASSSIEHWLYALNSAELHLPFVYLIAYTAGIHFVHYYKFILAKAQRKDGTSPKRVLFIRITVSLVLLYSLRRAYPESMMPFLDVRQRPTLIFHQPGAAALYGIWTIYVLLVIPEAVIGAFFTNGALAMNWVNFSRSAHFQVYVQMLFVELRNPFRIYDNFVMRWLVCGSIAIQYAYLWGLGAIYLQNLAKRVWGAVRSRISEKFESSINI